MKRKRIFTTLNYIEPLAVLRYLIFLPPANEVCEGYVFTCVCLSTGGCAWQGACVHGRGACMCGRGACMVGGHVWQGDVHGKGGMHGKGVCMAGGACMAGGHVWQGGMAHTPGRYHEIWSMSGQYASYWNAFLFLYPITQAIKPGFGVLPQPIKYSFEWNEILTVICVIFQNEEPLMTNSDNSDFTEMGIVEAWQGACMHGRGACMCGRGHA